MIQYHYSIHICIPKKIRTPSVDASKVFYEDSVIWRNMDTEISMSLKCVRCVKMCERGGRSTCVSACEIGRTYFRILNV